MATLKELIEQRIDRLESVPNNLLSKIDKQNEVLFKALLKELNSLDVKDGQIVTSTENLAKVGGIIEKLKDVLFQGEYLEAVKTFATEINSQATLNNQILDKVVGGFEDNELYTATIRSAQKNALLLLDESAIRAELLQPLTDILQNSIVTSASFLDAVETLRQNMTGDKALLQKYAGVYVKDVFSISDRQYAELIARQHQIEFYRYDGGKVDDTRQFCLERRNKIFHEKEIREWARGINTRVGEFLRPAKNPVYVTPQGEDMYWEGEHAGTNSATIFSYVGGWNCQHLLVAVATEFVPEADKQRARDLGFFKP